mgnify:CR=1 FL=1
MNNLIYQEAETEVVSYFTKLIGEAIEPYAYEISGSYKLSGLREKIILNFKKALELIFGWGFSSNEEPAKSKYYEDIAGVCAHKICEEVSEELFSVYRRNSENSFFLIDFRAYSSKVSEFLESLFKRISKRRKSCYSKTS